MDFSPEFVSKFWTKVEKGDACWLWRGCVSKFGHGVVTFRQKSFYAHRVSWEIANGAIPKGMCVLHRCDVPACVNPAHLWLGTKTDNARDRDQKGRHRPPNKLIPEQVLLIRALAKQGIKRRTLAAQFSVCEGTINAAVYRKTWAHL